MIRLYINTVLLIVSMMALVSGCADEIAIQPTGSRSFNGEKLPAQVAPIATERVIIITQEAKVIVVTQPPVIVVATATRIPTPKPAQPTPTPAIRKGPVALVAVHSSTGHTEIVSPSAGSPDAVVNADMLNLRSGPGEAYQSIGKYPAGTQLNVIGRNSDSFWVRVQIPSDGAIGWMRTSYVLFYLDLGTVVIVEP